MKNEMLVDLVREAYATAEGATVPGTSVEVKQTHLERVLRLLAPVVDQLPGRLTAALLVAVALGGCAPLATTLRQEWDAQRATYITARAAREAAVEALRPGMSFAEVHRALGESEGLIQTAELRGENGTWERCESLIDAHFGLCYAYYFHDGRLTDWYRGR